MRHRSNLRFLSAVLALAGGCGLLHGQAATSTQTSAPAAETAPVSTPAQAGQPGTAVLQSAPASGTQQQPQQPPAPVERQSGVYTLHTTVGEVRLNASVLENGRSVPGLPQSDFHVFEDGVPQTINYFRYEDVPVSLGILIDSSGSMYDKRAAVGKASLDLIKLSNPSDEAFLVDFSWEPYLDQEFTHDINKLQQGLTYVKASGGTAIYDAVIASADYLAHNAKQPKQVLLLVTDGDDNASTSTLEEAIRRVQELDGPTIYCVGLLFGPDEDKHETRHARHVLETLAEQTGGVAYFPRKLDDVDSITTQVAEDIRQQYSISYSSTKPASAGGYRTIHVEAHDPHKGKLVVRTRTGYFPKGSKQTAPGSAPNP